MNQSPIIERSIGDERICISGVWKGTAYSGREERRDLTTVTISTVSTEYSIYSVHYGERSDQVELSCPSYFSLDGGR